MIVDPDTFGVRGLGPGDAVCIPAGEMHKSMNDSKEEAALVWMLIEKGP